MKRDHDRNEDLHVATTLLQAAEDHAVELHDEIMDLQAQLAHWDSRVRAMVHAADAKANLLKLGEPDTFIHAWVDELLAETQRAAPDLTGTAPNEGSAQGLTR